MNPADRATIVATSLTKRYGDLVAVRDIDFAIMPGECFGFLGPNGAGKTTTMKMVGCVSPPSGGYLRVLGMSVTSSARTIKSRLGVVPQDDNLENQLTVHENLQLYGRYFGLGGHQLQDRIDELLEFVELRRKQHAGVRELSGGMRRRLIIARALINRPEILLLDEPTTGLDPQARHLVWERLRQLKSQAHTLLLTTHYMEEAEQLCDRLVIMENGEFVATGTPRGLIAEHVSSEIVEIYGSPDRHPSGLLDRVAQMITSSETLQDRLVLSTDDAEPLVRYLTDLHDPKLEFLRRRATLEDVFLKLTGRQLGTN